MADRAVRLGPRILVVAALRSTLEPTAQLISQSAAALQAEVVLQPCGSMARGLTSSAGDRGAYIEAIVAAVRRAAPFSTWWCGGQASMADAADGCCKTSASRC